MTLKIGLTPWYMGIDDGIGSICQQATLAEGWGFESIFFPEHHFSPTGAIPDPLMLLASVAAVTKTLRLGTTSYLLPLRNPVLAAEQVAVLDRLSGGRVILGIGRGYAPGMFDVFDVDPHEKRSIFAKNLGIMQRAWRGEPLSIGNDGNEIRISPLPVQEPHPPIYVAAFGPLALKQAGRLGFPYLPSPMETKTRLHENYATHVSACEAAGIPVQEERPIMRSVFVSQNQREVTRVHERLERESTSLARRDPAKEKHVSASDWAIVGSPAHLKDQVNEYIERFGMTQIVITRLRIGGVPSESLGQSMKLAAETLLR